ncbi:MAG: MarR family transcriptional regulator [Bacteroidota bacterium]
MQEQETTRNFGAIMDRTLKLIKYSYLQTFKELSLDITTEQWVILDRLAEGDGISQTDLANDSFKNAPTVSRIIELLRKKGLIEKKQSADDRRQSLIYLTNKGNEYHETATPAVLALRRRGWQGLNEQDYDDFMRIMNKIGSNFTED